MVADEMTEQLGTALAAALRGDTAGARLVVDLLPASQLRPALTRLVVAVAAVVDARAPGHGEEFADLVARLTRDEEGVDG